MYCTLYNGWFDHLDMYSSVKLCMPRDEQMSEKEWDLKRKISCTSCCTRAAFIRLHFTSNLKAEVLTPTSSCDDILAHVSRWISSVQRPEGGSCVPLELTEGDVVFNKCPFHKRFSFMWPIILPPCHHVTRTHTYTSTYQKKTKGRCCCCTGTGISPVFWAQCPRFRARLIEILQ